MPSHKLLFPILLLVFFSSFATIILSHASPEEIQSVVSQLHEQELEQQRTQIIEGYILIAIASFLAGIIISWLTWYLIRNHK